MKILTKQKLNIAFEEIRKRHNIERFNFSEDEVITALECCVKGPCRNCPLHDEKSSKCIGILLKRALLVIHNLQAEKEEMRAMMKAFIIIKEEKER